MAAARLTRTPFRPDEAEQARLGALRASRKSPLWPSHVKGASRQAEATSQACPRGPLHGRDLPERDPPGMPQGRLPGVSPNMVRHATATRLRRELGNLDSVRTILGHSDLDTSVIYAEADSDKAREIMAKLG